MLRRFAIPRHRFDGVLRYALAGGVHRAKVVLRVRIPLLRRFTKPRECFDVVLRYALAGGVHHPKVDLRGRIPLLRRFAIPRHRFDGVLRHPLAGGVHRTKVVLRVRMPLLRSPVVQVFSQVALLIDWRPGWLTRSRRRSRRQHPCQTSDVLHDSSLLEKRLHAGS